MRTAALFIALALSFATSTTHALVAPMRALDQTWFVGTSADFRVDMVDVRVSQVEGAPSSSEWLIDAELSVRRVTVSDGPAELAIVDNEAFTDATVAYIDGVLTETGAIVLRQDPANPEHTYLRARRLTVDVAADRATIVRVQMRASGTIDTLGQVFLELPTHALGLFEGTVTAGVMRLEFLGRPHGFQTTLTGGVSYDDPVSEVSWRLREWSPRIPFRASFLTSWSALLLIAEVEGCPDPWRVVRAVTGGDVDELRNYVGGHDDPTLEFCGNLPEILHGRWFASEQTRTQLAGMTLDRYVPEAQPVSLYAPNHRFDEALLGDAEAIYARSLRTVLSERQ